MSDGANDGCMYCPSGQDKHSTENCPKHKTPKVLPLCVHCKMPVEDWYKVYTSYPREGKGWHFANRGGCEKALGTKVVELEKRIRQLEGSVQELEGYP